MLRSVLSANRVKNQEEKASSDTRDLAVPFRSVSVLTRGMAEVYDSIMKRKEAGKWKEQEKKQDSREERTDNSPYHKQPRLTKRTTSKLQQHLNRGMTAFLVVAASIVFYFAFLRFGHISGVLGKIFQILKPIIYGFVLAYLLNPLMKMVENFIVKLLKGKIKKEERLKKFARGVGIFTALLFAGALIIALCNMILPELYRSIRNMVYTVPEQLNEWMERLSEMEFDDSTLR